MILPGLADVAHALALHAFRQRVLANNLANATTPGFLAQDVEDTSTAFGRVLSDTLALARSDGRHLADSSAPAAAGPLDSGEMTVVTTDALAGPDGNTVDRDATMAALASNALAYRALAAAANLQIVIARTGLFS